jgi:putative nucleotidyltransferase with HDIG domain
MLTATLKTRLFWAAEGLVLAATLTAAGLLSHTDEWQPILLVAVLLVLTLVGQQLSAAVGGGQLTSAHIALVLAMCLLGVAPAVFCGLCTAVLTSGYRRVSASRWLNNLVTFALFPFVGALMARSLAGDIHSGAAQKAAESIEFGLIVFAVFLATIALNFLLVALDVNVEEGRSLGRQTREAFIPVLPGHLAAGLLAAIMAVAYTNLGLPVLIGSILVLMTFHYLTMALLRSEDRADQLEARSIHLANLRLGVLSMLMDALALRDMATRRHATAVARYAKAMAVDLGCDEEQQEVVHTAALLHDIGKFAWSDRILHPDQLTDEDWAIIRRHPQDGAALVGKLDGYGPVADAILYHHERVDGSGYPAALIGDEIPLASRIVAVCSTYDTMTKRTTFGPAMGMQEAVAELRAVSGTQLDAELVERFVALLERDESLAVADYDDAAYEAEFALEQRVRRMAQPASR